MLSVFSESCELKEGSEFTEGNSKQGKKYMKNMYVYMWRKIYIYIKCNINNYIYMYICVFRFEMYSKCVLYIF